MKHLVFWVKKNREKLLEVIVASICAFLFMAMFVLQDFVVIASIVINVVLFGYSVIRG